MASCVVLQDELDRLGARVAIAESDARRDAARIEEVERRAGESRRDLDHAHQELTAAYVGGLETILAHADELSAVRVDARQAEALIAR